MLTLMVTDEHLRATISLSASPAIYQEYIPGVDHLRINCFGDEILAFKLTTEELDWRGNLNIPCRPVELDANLKQKLLLVLELLNLRMGVIDLKLTPEGEPVWLEVNPQGQFLFLEALTGTPLIRVFAEFLCNQARARRQTKLLSEYTN